MKKEEENNLNRQRLREISQMFIWYFELNFNQYEKRKHARCEQIKNENKPLKIQKNKTILFEHLKKTTDTVIYTHMPLVEYTVFDFISTKTKKPFRYK